MPAYEELGFGQGAALTGDRARTVFGHVMGLVAFTLAFSALGAYVARNMTGGAGFMFFLGAIACVVGLNYAAARGREQLAVGLLFGMGLLLGMFVAPVLTYYAHTDPGVVYQAAGSTALFVGILGTAGYLTRRDLSAWAKPLLIALIGGIVLGFIAMLLAVPGANLVYCLFMLVVFGGFTVIDFNRLKATNQYNSAVPIAAAIVLDIFNVFLLLLSLFGGGGSRR